MYIIKATSPTDAGLQSHRYLLDSGNKKVMNESINMVVEIEDNFDIDKTFDSTFREIFGDDRIDYASSVTFVPPKQHPFMEGLQYQQNDVSVKWNKTYWGRMINWDMPCLLSVDLKPRKEGLYLTAFFRSMRISKSGYADWVALCELGKFLCEQADLKLKRVTTIGGSVHLGDMNNEKKNVRKLFDVWNS